MTDDDPNIDDIVADMEHTIQTILNSPPKPPRHHIGPRVFAAAILCAKDDGVSIDAWFLLNWPHRSYRLAPYLEEGTGPDA